MVDLHGEAVAGGFGLDDQGLASGLGCRGHEDFGSGSDRSRRDGHGEVAGIYHTAADGSVPRNRVLSRDLELLSADRFRFDHLSFNIPSRMDIP